MSARIFYSVRMRASTSGHHLSGAERLIGESLLAKTVTELVDRARGKGTPAEQVVVTIDTIPVDQLHYIQALDLVDVLEGDVSACRLAARRALERAGVSASAIDAAMDALDHGPAPSGGNMRGAMIMDARTGERLEPDRERGIRASRFDWTDEAAGQTDRALAALGLIHLRTREALALASKVASAPGIVAELCWSDDPEYTAGYVAGPAHGYLRFPHLKRVGVPTGGRAFFIDRDAWEYESFRHYLQTVPVLITGIGTMQSGGAGERGSSR